MNPPSRRPLLGLAVAATVGLAALYPREAHTIAQETEASAYPVATPRRDTVHVERAFVAEIAAVRHAELRARVDGVLEALDVDEGESVREGAVLFRVNPRAFDQEVAVARAQVRQAEAELAAARLDRDHSQQLVDQHVISPAELAMVQARVDALEATREERSANAGLAEVHRDLATIRAPFDGTVNRIPRKAGSLVSAGDLLTSITDTREVFAWFHLSERDALAWFGSDDATGREVSLRLADGSLHGSTGVIDAAEAEFDEHGTMALRARFPNPDGLLRHGSSGTVVVRDPLPDALLVPQRSTFDVQGNLYVYLVDDGQMARARKITPLVRHDQDFVIADGLTEADTFILEGVQRVRDGDRVVTRPAGER